MKKLIVILIILFALSLTGILYSIQDQSTMQEMVTVDQVYMSGLPDQMRQQDQGAGLRVRGDLRLTQHAICIGILFPRHAAG